MGRNRGDVHLHLHTLEARWLYVGVTLSTPAVLVTLSWLVRQNGLGGAVRRLLLTAVVIAPPIGMSRLVDRVLPSPWLQLVMLAVFFVYLFAVVGLLRRVRGRRSSDA